MRPYAKMGVTLAPTMTSIHERAANFFDKVLSDLPKYVEKLRPLENEYWTLHG